MNRTMTVTTMDGKEYSTSMSSDKAFESIEDIDTSKDIKMVSTDDSDWFVIPKNTVQVIVYKKDGVSNE
jgi:hypothetical protein